jgi:uncharacterized protein
MRVRGYAPGTPCWVEVSSPDPVAAQAFYAELFGWTAGASPAGRTTFLLADRVVAGVRPAEAAQWLTYFATDDLASTADTVSAAGGAVLRPPAGNGTDGWAALFADPAGAVFAGWQREAFAGAQVNNEPAAPCWSELSTPDLDRAGTFYSRVFGWSDRPAEWQDDQRSSGGIAVAERPATDNPQWTTCFVVVDCAATAARAAELGGAVLAGPYPGAAGRVVQLADPQGARFAVIEPPPEVLASLR